MIDYFRGIVTSQTEKLHRLFGEEPVAISDLILTEVLQGFDHERDFNDARKMLTSLTVVELGGQEIAIQAAKNFRTLRRLGVTIRKTIGTVIASRCIESGHALLHADRDSRVVVILAERRNHHPSDIANLGVVENTLQPIANFNSVFPRVHHNEHQDAAIRSLRAHLPLLFKRDGEVVYGLVIIESFYRDDGDLRVSLAIDLSTEILEIVFR